MSEQFKDFRQAQLDGAKFNQERVSSEFQVFHFDLSDGASLRDIFASNKIDFHFISLWVCDWSNPSFKAKIKLNYKTDQGHAIPLRANMKLASDFAIPCAALEFAPQPNEWIDIAISSTVKLDVGNTVNAQVISMQSGKYYRCEKKTIEQAPKPIVCYGSDRKVEIRNDSYMPVYLGSWISLSSADFVHTSIRLPSGASYVYDADEELYARVLPLEYVTIQTTTYQL